MHHHRQLARHGDDRSLETHSFPKSDAPGPSAELQVKMTVAAS
jgi:hypothetical protein